MTDRKRATGGSRLGAGERGKEKKGFLITVLCIIRTAREAKRRQGGRQQALPCFRMPWRVTCGLGNGNRCGSKQRVFLCHLNARVEPSCCRVVQKGPCLASSPARVTRRNPGI